MSKIVVQEWIEQSMSGRSVLSIAKEYGVSFWMVSSRMRKAGYIPAVWNKGTLAEADRAWIAAVLDCEGTVTIHTPWNKRRNNRNIQVFTRVDMTDEGIPRRLHALCAGTFKPLHPRPTVTNNNKPHCYWNLASNGLRWLLPQIYPYLIVKRRHAEILIEVLEHNRRGARSCQMKYERLYELLSELRSLNQRGMKADLLNIRNVAS